MRERIRILLLIYGLLLVAAGSTALKPPRPKFKIATTSTTTTTEEPEPEEPEVTTVQTDVNATTGHTLTGIPQIDYIWDPNLPRELNGFNLSSYPFYSTVPTEEINFKCDGLHDGFYASIEHKCQVYHHCLYGTRYDFLCANFTAFDQKTFICHFASEVDCANSKKYWHRNDALYQATTTTTTSTTTTSTAAPPPAPAASGGVIRMGRPPLRDREINNRRRIRPFRRRPAYDYYDDEEEYYDEEPHSVRPRVYDRRDGYEYDDRNFRNDRDRDRERDRDRDYREPERDRTRNRARENPSGYGATREANDQRPLYEDRDQREREKIPAARPNRRDRRPVVDQFDEDPKPLTRDRTRDPETASYPDEKDSPDTRARDPPRDTDDRRYSDKRYRNDYDDKDQAPVVAGGSGGLVKPAAPSTSVYARPRAPPKIRRPVPVSEQNKYAYNASASAAVATPIDEPRRRPDPVDDDYLDEEAETRPRRPARRRPAYRDKEIYDAREPVRDRERDRDRDRNYRTRYQDEDADEVLPRKRPDRQRDRQYERGDRLHTYDRDRPALDRTTSSPFTERPAVQYPSRSAERQSASVNTRPSSRDEGFNRAKFPVREREPPAIVQSEPLKKPNYHNPRMEKTIGHDPAQTFRDQEDEDDRDGYLDVEGEPRIEDSREKTTEQRFSEPEVIPEEPSPRLSSVLRGNHKYENSSPQKPSGKDYPAESSSEYYDEPEDLPASSPRTTLRIVKRPFLPSRGGNPNPRGLKQVGSRVEPRPEEERSNVRNSGRTNSGEDTSETFEDRKYSSRRQPYDAYRTIQSDVRQPKEETGDEGVEARPQSRRLQKEDSLSDLREDPERFSNREESAPEDDYNGESSQSPNVPITDPESSQRQSAENSDGQKPNDVAHRLQDIPESEYDVTLNEALTQPLTQDSNLPSGFILPLHRQLERDTNLQSSQRNYLFTRPTESVAQLKLSPTSGSNSFHVPPAVERSRTTFPRPPQGSVFAPDHQPAPWQGYVEY